MGIALLDALDDCAVLKIRVSNLNACGAVAHGEAVETLAKGSEIMTRLSLTRRNVQKYRQGVIQRRNYRVEIREILGNFFRTSLVI